MFNTSLEHSSTLESFHAWIIGKSAVLHNPRLRTQRQSITSACGNRLQQPIVKRYLRKLSCVNAAVFAPSPGADDKQKLFCNVVVVCGSTDILIEPGSPRENG
jgi:hypothetical protein